MAELITLFFLSQLAWIEWRYARVRRLSAGRIAYLRFFQFLSTAVVLCVLSVSFVLGWLGSFISFVVFFWRFQSYVKRSLALVAAAPDRLDEPLFSSEVKFLQTIKHERLDEVLSAKIEKKQGAATVPQNTFQSRAIVNRENIDIVCFDYLDDKGEFSSREVCVSMVGQSEFGGEDFAEGELRTFKYDRVAGDIVSVMTGEVIEPSSWADDLSQSCRILEHPAIALKRQSFSSFSTELSLCFRGRENGRQPIGANSA